MAQTLVELSHPGDFLGNKVPERGDIFLHNGVLSAEADLHDGAILCREVEGDDESDLVEWTGSGTIVGVLLEPDKAELEARRRVVFAAGAPAVAIRQKLLLPEGLEEEAIAGLYATGMIVRGEDRIGSIHA